MARRPTAGPRFPISAKLALPPLVVGHARQHLADAIGLDREALDRWTLPQCPDLWTGFDWAFQDVLDRLAAAHTGPPARVVSAEIGDFVEDHLVPLGGLTRH